MNEICYIAYLMTADQKVLIFKEGSAIMAYELAIGDSLKVKGAGDYLILNIFRDQEQDENVIYKEIGLFCRRVDTYEF